MNDLQHMIAATAGTFALGILCVFGDIPGGAMFFGFFAGVMATTAAIIHAKLHTAP